MHNRSILISGAGVVGPALAYWVVQAGFQPVIVERAPQFRTGGYIIDFWGVGYDVTEKMGILPNIREKGYQVQDIEFVNKNGKRIGGFKASVFDKATKGRFTSIARGDLAQEIYKTLEDNVETIFGDSIVSLQETDDRVMVTFEHAPARAFDLVIGTDGLHSAVRELTFGPQAQFEKHLGYMTAAFEIKGYPHRDTDTYVSYNIPGKQAVRFAMRDDTTLFFFVFPSDTLMIPNPHDTVAHKALMHQAFDDAGWECKEIMDAMDTCEELYFDRVSQIHMDSWSKGRVTLVGDAAFCPSLLAGEGTSLGIAGAYVLARALADNNGDYQKAFTEYEKEYKPLMLKKQKAAESFAGSFAPRTAFGLWFRNMSAKLFVIPFFAQLFVGSSVQDDFTIE